MIRPFWDLTKPRITWLILMSTAVGFVFGARLGWTWQTLLHCLVGTGLLASGTAALNQWYERDADGLMKRTQGRPIPAGLVSPRAAFWFGLALIVAGFLDLALGDNWLTAALGLFTVLSYLAAYTPMKQRSTHATTVGAIPGAMPPMIGFAAASGTLNAEAWILFAILFLWQFPHFYAIAWMYREDYARAGMRMLAVVEPDGESTAKRIFWTSIALIPLSILPRVLGMAGDIYVAGVLIIGGVFVYTTYRVLRDLNRTGARNVLLASVVYLPVLYGLLVFDRGL
ncbi:MAG TPA: heme o synthase [Bryobacteraceae bacterium]|jgi:protoheme IX farnesyltransferase